MLLIAFFVAVWMAKRRAPRFGLTPQNVYDGAFWALILGVFGARIVYILQEWKYYSAHTSEILSWQFAGLTSFGAIIFGIIGLYVYCRKQKISLIRMLDVIAGPFLIAHAIGRVGCLLNGCCYGGVCDLPWGIHVAGQTALFHPAQIYDSLLNVAGFGILVWRERKSIAWGQSAALCLILHGTARFIYEFWRAGTDAQVAQGLATSTYMGSLPITDAQAAALVVVLAGALLFVYSRYREKGSERKVAALET
jgi:phosphatidylglycerol:prolipoprotein diacylglycerol transferase